VKNETNAAYSPRSRDLWLIFNTTRNAVKKTPEMLNHAVQATLPLIPACFNPNGSDKLVLAREEWPLTSQ
jgi:hypothetical protein